MHSSTFLSVVAGGFLAQLASASALGPRQASNMTACATSVHMIVARASTEMPGQGIIGAVATKVQNAMPGSDSEAVVYPATLTDYLASEASGVAAMTKMIEEYSARCPNSKIALMGYSQGAQVVGDVLCGTSEANFNTTQPIAEKYQKNIVAVIQMGDPSHMPNLPQNVGNSTKAGIFPRPNTAACKNMEPMTKAYCNADDRFCDSGTSVPVHLAYVQNFGTQAADFVMKMVMGNSSMSMGGESGTATASSSSGAKGAGGSSPSATATAKPTTNGGAERAGVNSAAAWIAALVLGVVLYL
ncbi:hypothetical protein LZ554_005695 [Drepanopeziza brunnea f. sp. 'monogermtubi']|nr:hypothetical protein LZ554_005695 [Drepanopeziza brunnea f. sp. 'monogermtubi']